MNCAYYEAALLTADCHEEASIMPNAVSDQAFVKIKCRWNSLAVDEQYCTYHRVLKPHMSIEQ